MVIYFMLRKNQKLTAATGASGRAAVFMAIVAIPTVVVMAAIARTIVPITWCVENDSQLVLVQELSEFGEVFLVYFRFFFAKGDSFFDGLVSVAVIILMGMPCQQLFQIVAIERFKAEGFLSVESEITAHPVCLTVKIPFVISRGAGR